MYVYSALRLLQTALLRQKFVEVLQNYQQVERDYRAKYRQRVERQFKIGAYHAYSISLKPIADFDVFSQT